MRKQYHFKSSPNGYYAWDVDNLIELSKKLNVIQFPISEIKELDEPHWYGEDNSIPTCRSIVEHMKLIHAVDLKFPVILSAEHSVMDGMHRVARALFEGHDTIKAKIFGKTPAPDFTDIYPDELEY